MRGKVKPVPGKARQNRITPAYAGKSDRLTNGSDDLGDHPRLCGEKTANCKAGFTAEGSPPPMRGKE